MKLSSAAACTAAGFSSQVEAFTALAGKRVAGTGTVLPLGVGRAAVQLGCPIVLRRKIGVAFHGHLFPGEFLQSDLSVTFLDFTQCLL